MKGLKKIALATAIAAAPFVAHADMQALDDSAMGNVTGQAGVTIELETKVNIGEFSYTDTDGYGNETEGGSFVVSDITIGGAAVGGGTDLINRDASLLDDLAIEIDVAANGDAIIHVAGLTDSGSKDPQGNPVMLPIDWGVDIGEMKLRSSTGTETTLISGMTGYGYLAKLDIAVRNNDKFAAGQKAGTGALELTAAFNVAKMDLDVDFLSVGIRDLAISGSLPGNGTTGNPMADAYLAAGYAFLDVDVYSGGAKAAGVEEALNIDVNNVYLDITVGDILVGSSTAGTSPDLSIGSVALKNVAITDTKLVVYGH
ncbi:DUF6160 family protein [Marinobacter sp. S6332]|uniref:DUF6160 family protein n=1 Tax=Marinobacter sp. S6332 TaxID=2926403 RepID=UPI001FF1527A|nr:DUF6160 family protein [Marinobacter sp. S6332]MCK0164038.1 DUF6160 family protein [Marinobacter sp. S6332]